MPVDAQTGEAIGLSVKSNDCQVVPTHQAMANVHPTDPTGLGVDKVRMQAN